MSLPRSFGGYFAMEYLKIRGARQHNLKNLDIDIPKNKLVVLTGLSGSGKSSLALDTIYAEGQRRYVESLSSYARQFLGVMDKPEVDSIEGLSPAIAIDQKSGSHNPRSTVGTVTEIYDYLRLLFARIGHPHCPNCQREISRQSLVEIVNQILKLAQSLVKSQKYFRFFVLSPVVRDRKGEFSGLFANLKAKGFRQVRVDSHFYGIDEDLFLIKTNKHNVEAVIDRVALPTADLNKENLMTTFRTRLLEAVETGLNLSQGLVIISQISDPGFSIPEKPKQTTDHLFSERFACPVCNLALPEIEPRTFSFNSPHGACPVCSGIGTTLTVDQALVVNPELSITEGGLLPFAKMFFHDTWFSRIITTVCQSAGINLRAPLKNLTTKQRQILLYGTADEFYRVSGTNRFGEQTSINETFAGLIPELLRRYLASTSDYVRREIEKYMRKETCQSCAGRRLKPESLTITIDGKSIADITDLSIDEALFWINALGKTINLNIEEQTIARPLVKEISSRLQFLLSVGLNYLTLSRAAATLAGGEAQRIRLASQIGSGLSGVLYILDEPSVGLHPRDNDRLIKTLKMLRDLDNTVIVVEHDRDMMLSADWLIDIGPGAGEHGGRIVAQGTAQEILKNPKSLTGLYLSGKRGISRKLSCLSKSGLQNQNNQIGGLGFSANNGFGQNDKHSLTICDIKHHNLKNITVNFPLGKFICVTGVSGSGKSSLVVETVYQALYNHFNSLTKERAGQHTQIDGLANIDKVILVDQSPIGRTPRSNPATYTGLFSPIREIFSQLPDAKLRGYRAGRFSFNVKGGRCEACEGEGQKKIEMQFLADIYVTCEVCHGSRYNEETLEVRYRGCNIAQILEMTVEEAREFLKSFRLIATKLDTLHEVGLDYLHLGQPAPTLSGGEAQRVKLATELSRRGSGKTVYILDEPTTGLHFADLDKLLNVLVRLTQLGNTVIVIEHNLDLIKNADWLIDLGPEGGDAGGQIIAQGPPCEVAKVEHSYTGQFLKKIIK